MEFHRTGYVFEESREKDAFLHFLGVYDMLHPGKAPDASPLEIIATGLLYAKRTDILTPMAKTAVRPFPLVRDGVLCPAFECHIGPLTSRGAVIPGAELFDIIGNAGACDIRFISDIAVTEGKIQGPLPFGVSTLENIPGTEAAVVIFGDGKAASLPSDALYFVPEYPACDAAAPWQGRENGDIGDIYFPAGSIHGSIYSTAAGDRALLLPLWDVEDPSPFIKGYGGIDEIFERARCEGFCTDTYVLTLCLPSGGGPAQVCAALGIFEALCAYGRELSVRLVPYLSEPVLALYLPKGRSL